MEEQGFGEGGRDVGHVGLVLDVRSWVEESDSNMLELVILRSEEMGDNKTATYRSLSGTVPSHARVLESLTKT